MDFYYYMVVVYTHSQHTFQFKQLVKVHVASDDPFNLAVQCNPSFSLSYLGLQVDVGQRHLGDLVETQWEWDGAEDEQCVVDGHTHQHYSLGVGLRHLHQQSTGQVHQQEDDADAQEEQVQRQPDETPQSEASALLQHDASLL